MVTSPKAGPRANALKGRELANTLEDTSAAPPEVVWDVLADLRTHRVWGGERQRASTRILELEAPEGPASVGTEFGTVGADPMGRFEDRSVVTEAVRPETLEFVTEARLHTKRGRAVDWTVIHRYELAPAEGSGCRIRYTTRITRVSELPGLLRTMALPGLGALAMKGSAPVGRRGLRNLAAMAEEERIGDSGEGRGEA
jgi:uncharacterized protein YndB with AHSA1/START domain